MGNISWKLTADSVSPPIMAPMASMAPTPLGPHFESQFSCRRSSILDDVAPLGGEDHVSSPSEAQ